MRIEIETERIGEERVRWRERKIARKSDNGAMGERKIKKRDRIDDR